MILLFNLKDSDCSSYSDYVTYVTNFPIPMRTAKKHDTVYPILLNSDNFIHNKCNKFV